MLVEYKGKTWTDLDEAIKAFSEPVKFGDYVHYEGGGFVDVIAVVGKEAWVKNSYGSWVINTDRKFKFSGRVNHAYTEDILGRLRELKAKEVENARLEEALKANARALREASYVHVSYDMGKYECQSAHYCKFAIGDKVYSKYTPHIVRTVTKYDASRNKYYCDYNLGYGYASSDLNTAYKLKVGDLVVSGNNGGYTYEVVGLGERPNTYDVRVVDRDFVYKNTDGNILIKVTHQPFGLGRIVKYKNGRDHYRVEGMTTFKNGVTKYALFNLNNRKDYYEVEHNRLELV